jgi:hypothetical protein
MRSHLPHARVSRHLAAAAITAALLCCLSACQMAQNGSPARASETPEYPELGRIIGGIITALADGF